MSNPGKMLPSYTLPAPPQRPLRLGIIGAGGIARSSHLPALEWLRQQGWPIRVAAIADPDTNRIAASGKVAPVVLEGADHYADGRELLRQGGMDALLLLTLPAVTSALLPEALATGIPLLAEKPVAENPDGLAAALAAEARPGASPLRIGYNRRSLPFALPFRERLHGDLPEGKNLALHLEARLWRANRHESIFYEDTMIHAIDFLLWCLGPLVVQRVTLWPPETPGALPSGLRAELTSSPFPATAHLDVRPAVGRNRESYEAMGREFLQELTYPLSLSVAETGAFSTYTRGTLQSALPGTGAGDPAGLIPRGFVPQLAAFLRFAAGETGPETGALCTLPEALAALRLREEILNQAQPLAEESGAAVRGPR